jgi:hypothetical protein
MIVQPVQSAPRLIGSGTLIALYFGPSQYPDDGREEAIGDFEGARFADRFGLTQES